MYRCTSILMMRPQTLAVTVLAFSAVGHVSAASSLRAEHAARYVEHDAERSATRSGGRWAGYVMARDSLATITTDTGALAPGDRDYSRYPNLAFCVLAAERQQALLRSSVTAHAVLDTLRDRQADTVGFTRVAAVARACAGSRLTVAGTAVSALPFLIELAVDAGADTVALAASLRDAASAPDTAHAIRALAWAEQLFLEAAPARVALAETVATRLDALGPSMVAAQMDAHETLLDFWLAARNYARAAPEAERLLAARHRVAGLVLTPDSGTVDPSVLKAYRALMARAFWARTDSLRAIARRAQADIRQLLVDPKQEPVFAKLSKMPLDSLVLELAPSLYGAVTRLQSPSPPEHIGCWGQQGAHDCQHLQGRELIPLQADAWFPAAGVDTMQPVPGKVTLAVGAAAWCTMAYQVGDEEHCFAPIATAIRRWLARYSPAGLTVTVVIATSEQTLMDGSVVPAQFAARARWYFQDYLRLPVTVAVENTQYLYLPPPDGRREPGNLTQFRKYGGPASDGINGRMLLFGRDRRVLYSNWHPYGIEWKEEEWTLDQLLEALFTPSAVVAPRTVPHALPGATPRSATPSSPALPGRT